MFSQLPFDSVTTYFKPTIRSVQIDMFVDKSVSQSKISKATEIAKKVLNINAKLIKVKTQKTPFFTLIRISLKIFQLLNLTKTHYKACYSSLYF